MNESALLLWGQSILYCPIIKKKQQHTRQGKVLSAQSHSREQSLSFITYLDKIELLATFYQETKNWDHYYTIHKYANTDDDTDYKCPLALVT